MGVVEYKFSILSGSNRGVQWRIYDVGGARNQRQAWAPYFEDGKSKWSGVWAILIPFYIYSERYHLLGANICIRPSSCRG